MPLLYTHLVRPLSATSNLARVWRVGLLSLLLAPLASQAQCLEAVGLSSSLLVTQTTVRPYTIAMPPSYTLDTRADGGRYDDIGYRLAAAVR